MVCTCMRTCMCMCMEEEEGEGELWSEGVCMDGCACVLCLLLLSTTCNDEIVVGSSRRVSLRAYRSDGGRRYNGANGLCSHNVSVWTGASSTSLSDAVQQTSGWVQVLVTTAQILTVQHSGLIPAVGQYVGCVCAGRCTLFPRVGGQ